MQEIHDFRGFFRISQRVFDLHEIFFGSQILLSSYNRHQNFDYWCSSYLADESQSPDFCRFLTTLGIIRAFCFGRSL